MGLSNFLTGIVPTSTIQTEIYWKEMDGDSEWTRANDAYDSGEDGYDSSRDEISSVSSYPNKSNLNRTFGSSLSLNSGPRLSMKDTSYVEERVGSSPKMMLSQLSAAVVSYDSGTDVSSPHKSSNSVVPSQQPKQTNGAGASMSPGAGAREPVPCKLLVISSLCLYIDSASTYLSRCNHFLQQKDLQEEDHTTLEWMTKSFLGFPPRMPILLITSAIL
jgi:hypothetical protein